MFDIAAMDSNWQETCYNKQGVMYRCVVTSGTDGRIYDMNSREPGQRMEELFTQGSIQRLRMGRFSHASHGSSEGTA